MTAATLATPPVGDGLAGLVVHPAAEIFPAATTGPEFDELVADIKAHGLRHCIARNLRGAIIDGRARALACRIADVAPRYRLWTGNPWRLAIAANDHRFTGSGHRAMLAAAIAYDTRSALNGIQTRELCRVSQGSMNRAKTVLRKGTPELQTLAATNRVQLTTAARIALLPIDAQNAFTEKVEAGADAQKAGPPGWRGNDLSRNPPLTKREARYRYVQEPALALMANSFEGLAIALASADGLLDPAITPEQAAQWRSDLSRQGKSYRQLLALLKDRSAQGA
ncbi:MAG: hypothetical protein ACRDTZ_01170 [Pseudonocardiaceae bacterium]